MSREGARLAEVPGGGAEPRGDRGPRTVRVGRFRVPAGDRRASLYFRRHLQVSHNLRERLVRCLPTWLVRRAWSAAGGEPGAPAPDAELEDLLGAVAGRTLRDCGLGEPDSLRWILRERGSPSDSGERLLFLFGDGGTAPAVVVRVRVDGDPTDALEREWRTLRRLRLELERDLAATLPEPVAYVREGGTVALASKSLPGRSAYVDLYSGLAPRRHARRHLEAAAEWLGAFHRARGRGTCLLTDVVDGEGPARNLELALVDGHGDFWPGNLLLDGRSAAVIDWSGYRKSVLPSTDLFHFPLSYAFQFPMSRYRRVPPEEAFRRAFLQDTWLSRRIHRYFRTYCRRAGLDARLLEPLLHHDLSCRARSAEAASTRGRPPGRGPVQEGATWKRLSELLARADRSVLSA